MKAENLNKSLGYRATWKEVKGVLVYFWVNTDSWCFAPEEGRDEAGAYKQVTDEEMETMKITKL